MQKKITLIGSTGSIGRQVIQVVQRYSEQFKIVAMTANLNIDLFTQQVKQIQPNFAVLRSTDCTVQSHGMQYAGDRKKMPIIHQGEKAFEEACQYPCDIVIVAATGFAGLKATLLAIEAGRTVALANKESLVVAGDLVMQKAREKQVEILPIDSEHSAIWQALHFQTVFNGKKEFSKLLLTASGGALRDLPLEKLRTVTAKEALAHPNWNMGSKITIDCATMLNKGYEVIEAMHLFGATLEEIEVVLHRESIIHSMVEWADGSILAQMGMPSMEIPIQLALTYPHRQSTQTKPIDWQSLKALHFDSMSKERYPCYYLALQAVKLGGIYPLVLNAWAEIAVDAFLKNKIAYTTIAQMIEKGLAALKENSSIESYLQLEQMDKYQRERALQSIKLF